MGFREIELMARKSADPLMTGRLVYLWMLDR